MPSCTNFSPTFQQLRPKAIALNQDRAEAQAPWKSLTKTGKEWNFDIKPDVRVELDSGTVQSFVTATAKDHGNQF
jgi:hypothetical protein